MVLNPVRGVLSGLPRIGRLLFLDDALDSTLHIRVYPRNVADVSIVVNISIENLIAHELGSVTINVLDGHRAIRIRRKRHGHRGHDSAEAQRRCEAGGYCQACDVLAHAHLLFLCFLLEFHLI